MQSDTENPLSGTQSMTMVRRGYTVAEVSALTTLSAVMVRKMIRDGRLKVVRLGRRIVISADELDRLMSIGDKT